MIGIHYSSAAEVATKMENAADNLERAVNKAMTTADKTTLQVNTDAQEANNDVVKSSRSLHQHFIETLKNIQFVAKDFKRVDEEISQTVDESIIMKDQPTYGNYTFR